MLRNIIFSFLAFYSNNLLSQPSLTKPQICHNSDGTPNCYNDSSYEISFNEGRFSGFRKNDSSIIYFEKDRHIELFNRVNNSIPVKIKIEDKTIVFDYDGKINKINSFHSKNLIVNGIEFSFVKNDYGPKVITYLNGKRVILKIWDLEKEKWSWEKIRINEDSSFFLITYNVYRNKGPEAIGHQDSRLKYGVLMFSSFRTSEYIWIIKPSFSEDNVLTTYADYYFEYDRKGRIRKKKSHGEIKYCDCN